MRKRNMVMGERNMGKKRNMGVGKRNMGEGDMGVGKRNIRKGNMGVGKQNMRRGNIGKGELVGGGGEHREGSGWGTWEREDGCEGEGYGEGEYRGGRTWVI